ncbi:MAG TPA: glycine--tRNA ligase subunit beta [Thermoanaerobaculia bacterium]|nr:glycine--tRNA ligase subunit beta [Thermoanaerobaculia bacterium]
MAELLIEIRADAFEPSTLPAVAQALRVSLVEELGAVGLAPRQVATAGTVRRVVVLLRALPDLAGEDNVASPAAGGAQAGAARDHVRRVAREAVQRGLESCRWPWPEDTSVAARWRGSLRGLLVLFDDTPLDIAAWGLSSRPETVGHPTLSPSPFEVRSVEQYRAELLALGIEVRIPERRKLLRERLFTAAAKAGGELVEDAALLDLAAAGCEIPGVATGELDPEHLALPRELVATALRERLQAFLLTTEGRLLPRFLAVVDRPDDPEGRAARGLSWTASALLHDIAFHWERDRRVPLAQRARQLEGEPWRDGLGTFGQRAERLEALVRDLATEWGWIEDVERAAEAVRLLHADAATALGHELPSLPGVIAGLLAREDGYPDAVWQAIHDHDRPATGTLLMPRGRCATLVAFAHWADALAGAAVLGELASVPQSAPGAARQWHAACALLRVALHRGLPVDLRLLAGQVLRRFGAQGFATEDAMPALAGFLETAAESVLREEGFADEEVAAVLLASASSQLSDVQARLRALRDLRRDPALRERLAPLVRTARRLESLLRDATEERIEIRLLATDEEKDIFVAVQATARTAAGLVDGSRPGAWLDSMEALDRSLQLLLRHVLVRDEDEQLRRNRVALLQEVLRLYTGQVRLAELSGDAEPTQDS